MACEVFYIGYDNSSRVQIKEDGVAQDLSAVTKVALKISGTVYDSDAYPDAFDYATEAASGVIRLALGKIGAITTTLKDNKAELIVYDPSNQNGIVWGTIKIKILDIDDV